MSFLTGFNKRFPRFRERALLIVGVPYFARDRRGDNMYKDFLSHCTPEYAGDFMAITILACIFGGWLYCLLAIASFAFGGYLLFVPLALIGVLHTVNWFVVGWFVTLARALYFLTAGILRFLFVV